MSESFPTTLERTVTSQPEVARQYSLAKVKEIGRGALSGAKEIFEDPRVQIAAATVKEKAVDAWEDPRTQAAAEAAKARAVAEAQAAKKRVGGRYIKETRSGGRKIKKGAVVRDALGLMRGSPSAIKRVSETVTGVDDVSVKGAVKSAGQRFGRGVAKDAVKAAGQAHINRGNEIMTEVDLTSPQALSSSDRAPDYVTGQPVESGGWYEPDAPPSPYGDIPPSPVNDAPDF